MWTDIDYMDKVSINDVCSQGDIIFESCSCIYFQYMDFTTDPVSFPSEDMKTFIEDLHMKGQHYGERR